MSDQYLYDYGTEFFEALDEHINDMHEDGVIKICDMSYDAAQALKALDLTAYSCMANDYANEVDYFNNQDKWRK